jgi:hypothetical protein
VGNPINTQLGCMSIRQKNTHGVWLPTYIAHPSPTADLHSSTTSRHTRRSTSTVCQTDDLLLPSEVPDASVP